MAGPEKEDRTSARDAHTAMTRRGGVQQKEEGATSARKKDTSEPGPLFPGTRAPAVPGHEKSARPF